MRPLRGGRRSGQEQVTRERGARAPLCLPGGRGGAYMGAERERGEGVTEVCAFFGGWGVARECAREQGASGGRGRDT